MEYQDTNDNHDELVDQLSKKLSEYVNQEMLESIESSDDLNRGLLMAIVRASVAVTYPLVFTLVDELEQNDALDKAEFFQKVEQILDEKLDQQDQAND